MPILPSALFTRRTIATACVTGSLVLGPAAYGSHTPGPPALGTPTSASASMPSGGNPSATPMPGMSPGNGLSAQQDGYTLTSPTATLPAGKAATYRFTITGPGGTPVTAFALNQTRRLHFYVIRSDLTGFQHLHPTMTGDGTWTAHLAPLQPGHWRLFTQFTPDTGPGKGRDFVLSRTLTVPGTAATTALPPPSASTMVDGYTLTLRGNLKAGMMSPLTVTIRKDGKSVTDLQPYLDTYAHLTAFHQGDQAFAHLHPQTKAAGGHGGPTLDFMVGLPASGNWRLFLQFQTAGTLHTAAVTLHVR
ncbi:hypothetical protein [Streptosporangium sp. NPDC049644]|uniref:hypothetical protein n=1 Tax=Streptosporangium sp. NPDC049644 TaxID=3155507 RepID=UPI00342ABCEE